MGHSFIEFMKKEYFRENSLRGDSLGEFLTSGFDGIAGFFTVGLILNL